MVCLLEDESTLLIRIQLDIHKSIQVLLSRAVSQTVSSQPVIHGLFYSHTDPCTSLCAEINTFLLAQPSRFPRSLWTGVLLFGMSVISPYFLSSTDLIKVQSS